MLYKTKYALGGNKALTGISNIPKEKLDFIQNKALCLGDF